VNSSQRVQWASNALDVTITLSVKLVPISSVLLLAPVAVFAQSKIETACDVIKLVDLVSSWFGIFVFTVAIMTILYAGLLFMIGGGNEETLKKAKRVLIWGLVGIAVALFARGAVAFVQNIIGGSVPGGC